MDLSIEGASPLVGEIAVPADKSMTHRALMLAALAQGASTIKAAFAGEDNHSTARVLKNLGVGIEHGEDTWRVQGRSAGALRAKTELLDCGNSGTTIRLMAGLLAGANVSAVMSGDASLQKRPMGRVIKPLRELGAEIAGRSENGRELPPLTLKPGNFKGGEYSLELASAQVKSALLFAGVASGQALFLREKTVSRDHSERMLKAMGAGLRHTARKDGGADIHLDAGAQLRGGDFNIAGDISGAAFLLCAGLLVPNSKITVRHVGVNPTRTGILEIFEEYGAKIQVTEWREEQGEPIAALTAVPTELNATQAGDQATVIGGSVIPRLIDELVVLAAVASQARGVTEVKDAGELRVKESDRVKETLRLLAAFGVKGEERADGFVVRGPQPLTAADLDVSSDHRIALSAAVLALAAPGKSILRGFDIAAVSFPSFVKSVAALGAKVQVLS